MKRFLWLPLALLVVAPLSAQTAAEKKETISYLHKLQTKGGGFLGKADDKAATLRATSAAIRALKYFGGEVPDTGAAVTFVASCHDKESGGFANEPGGKPDMFCSAVGAMAVVELKMPVERYETKLVSYLGKNARTFEEIRIAVAGLEALGKKPAEAEGWLDQIAKMRGEDGTFGKGDGLARDTGGATVALLRLGGKVANKETVLKALNAGQRKDGGFGKADTADSDLETSYRVMRAFHMLKARPEGADKLRKYLASCRNKDGGYAVQPGQGSTVGATYYASIILHWLEEK